MAIFSAGFIEYSGNKKALREKIYQKAKSELDSQALKIATKGGKGFVNFIAFLPKEKLQKQNILQKVAQCSGKCVVVFELDYKQVGVVCEDGMIVDYILDKPQVFAKEREYSVLLADNFSGQTLHTINLQKSKAELIISTVVTLFFIGFIVFAGISGYEYMQTYKTYEAQKHQLEKEYEAIVNKQLQQALKQIEKVDSVAVLNRVEKITKQTGSRLQQFSFNGGRFCVELVGNKGDALDKYRFEAVDVISRESGFVRYCYEKN